DLGCRTRGGRIDRDRLARPFARARATPGARRNGRRRARRGASAELHPLAAGARTRRAAVGVDRPDRSRPVGPALSPDRHRRRGPSPRCRAGRAHLQHPGRDRTHGRVSAAPSGAPRGCDRALSYDELRQRFDRLPAPNGIFAATDRLAMAALALAADRHLHVPRDVAIVGFDDIPLAALLRPSLSTITQPAHELGSVAVDMAQRLLAGEPVQPTVLLPRLVQRESTLGPGGRYA